MDLDLHRIKIAFIHFILILLTLSTIPATPKSPSSEKLRKSPNEMNLLFKGTVKMLNGQDIEGTITQVKDSEVQIKMAYGTIWVPLNQIDFTSTTNKSSEKAPWTPPQWLLDKKEKTNKNNQTPPPSSIKPVKNTALSNERFSPSNNFIKNFKSLKWIAYNPSKYSPGHEDLLQEQEIEEDLQILKKAGFNGLLTYSARHKIARIPEIAKKIGIKGVIMGIWDPRDKDEIQKATSFHPYVDAYCIGNEGIHFNRYTKDALLRTMHQVREATGKKVGTSEPLDIIFSKDHQVIWEKSDIIFVIAHFIFDDNLNSKDPRQGAKWLLNMNREIKKKLKVKAPIIFKEVGFPTYGEGWASEKQQKRFFKALAKKRVSFIYFEAFDQPWKQSQPFEPYWGIFSDNREPKSFAKYLLEKEKRQKST